MKGLLFGLLCTPILLSAQINESDTLRLMARLSLTGFWQSGNVETFIFRAKSDLSVRPWKKWVFKTQNSYIYQEFGRQKADEDILSLNFLYFDPEQKIYPQLLGFFSTNFRRRINMRYLLGAGVTFQVLEKESHWLKFSLSSEYETTAFAEPNFNRDAYDGNHTINTFRGTIWVNGKYHLFGDKIIVSHESYAQPSLEEGDNFRWQVDVGLEFPIWKFLNLKINYLHTFESVVIQGQEQEDRILSFGFTVKSYGE